MTASNLHINAATAALLAAFIFSPAQSGAKEWVLVPKVKGKAAKVAGQSLSALSAHRNSKKIESLGAMLVSSESAPVVPQGYSLAEAQPVQVLNQAPNDPRYPAQWNLSRVGAPSAWNQAASRGMSAQGMASLLSRGTPRMVAVVDTGIDDSHPDLNGKVYDGANFVDGGDYVDDHGHGTFVASLIGAITNNGIGMAGLSPNVQLLAVKVLNAGGGGSDFGVAQGVVWAVENGAQVINLSLGTFYDSQVMHDAVDYAISNNVLVVAASGNSGSQDLIYPAAWDGVLSVGASTHDDRRAHYSTYNANLSMMAPGGNADGDSTHEILGAEPGAVYAFGSGTSYAAPQVAAAAALFLSVNTSASAAQTFAALTGTADPISKQAGRCGQTGWGRLNTARLLGMDTAPNLFQPSVLPAGFGKEGGSVDVSVGAGEPVLSAANPDPSQVSQVWAFLLDADGNEVARQLLAQADAHDYRGTISVPAWDGASDRPLTLAFQAIDTTGHASANTLAGSSLQAAGRSQGLKWGSMILPKMLAYANPSPTVCVRVVSGQSDTFKLKVYDISGKMVSEFNAPVQAGENNFCLSDVLASGIYLAMGEQISQRQRNTIKLAIKR